MKKLLLITLMLKMYTMAAQCSVSLTAKDAYCGACNGIITSTPVGASPFTYSWSSGDTTPSIFGACAGNYTLTIRDNNNCQVVGIVSVAMQNPTFTYTAYAPTCGTCCNGSATLSYSSPYPPYTYSYSCTAQTTSVITGLCGGPCNIVITDSYNCGAGALMEYTQPLGLREFMPDDAFSIWPNPFSQETKISVASSAENIDLLVYNAFGEIVLKIENITESMTFTRGQLKSGVYFFRFRKKNSLSGAKKVVITD